MGGFHFGYGGHSHHPRAGAEHCQWEGYARGQAGKFQPVKEKEKPAPECQGPCDSRFTLLTGSPSFVFKAAIETIERLKAQIDSAFIYRLRYQAGPHWKPRASYP